MTKAKQKTCTIKVYQPFQARGWCADIYYRGKLIVGLIDADKNEVITSAVIACIKHGFTAFKVKE